MSFIVRFYDNFEKKVNSTKTPSNLVGTFVDFAIELKSPTNIFTPSIKLKADSFKDGDGNITAPTKYNYAYIMEFKRYYFIRSWVWVNGLWAADLEIDFMASHKTEIGNATAFVSRAYSEYDENVIDTKYLTKSDCMSWSKRQSSVWHTNINSGSIADGFFVIGVVNNDSGSVGAVSYYAVSGRDLRVFMSQLYASPSWLNITDASISNDLQKVLINPIQYIISCMFFPLSLSPSALSGIDTIPIGWWSITLPAGSLFYKLTNIYLQYDHSLEFAIPKHPDSTGAYKWLQNSPYSIYQLEFFPYGVFPLDSAKLYDFDKIRCEQKIDLMTGSGTLNVIRKKDGANYSGILFSVTSQVGIPISMAQMSVDMSKINSSSLVAAAGMGLLSDTSAVSEMVNSAVNFFETGVGGLGSAVSYDDYMYSLGEWFGNGRRGSMPTPQVNQNYLDGTAAAGKWLISSVGKVAANIGNAVIASAGSCKTTGTTGTLAQYYLDQVLTLFYFALTDTDPEHYGYPLAKNKKINTLSGFVLCANDGDLQIDGLAMERQAIVSTMTGGFYYE